jgi:hypothetical protein
MISANTGAALEAVAPFLQPISLGAFLGTVGAEL